MRDKIAKRLSKAQVLASIAATLACLLTLLAAPSAHAGYEVVKHFAPLNIPAEAPASESEFPEDTQLGGVAGMAVNRTGAGGVAAGTLYAIGSNKGDWHVARFSPTGEFELRWRFFGGPCGPKSGGGACPPAPLAPANALDVDIDQTTGNVYVFAQSNPGKTIRVYSPDGSTLIAEFGEPDSKGTIAATPEKIHDASPGDIAVDNTGKVYVFDLDKESKRRLAIFKPKTPGDYSEYEYAGEILGGVAPLPQRPVLDDAGNIYTADEETVQKFSPAGAKLCDFTYKKGGILSLTVNPVSEEVFFASYKESGKLHRLAPCSGGKFAEEAAVPPFAPQPPRRGDVTAMAFNPALAWSPGRPAGTLYAGAYDTCPTTGTCAEPTQSALGYVFAQPQSETPPAVSSQSVTAVTASGATLHAEINPNGPLTEYAFQYLSEDAYQEAGETFAGAGEAPLGGASLGVGQKALPAIATLTGLAPDTAYRYRVIATSHCSAAEPEKVCEGIGTARTLHTFALEAPGLPDRRAYELVSPAQKNGGEVYPPETEQSSCGVNCKPSPLGSRFPIQIAPGGDAVAYQGTTFTLNQGIHLFDEQLSRRTPSGWRSAGIGPPQVSEGTIEGTFFAHALDTDLTRAIVSTVNPALTPEAPLGVPNLFAEPTDDPLDLTPLLTFSPPNRVNDPPFEIKYAGASADLSRVFFAANDALTPATADAPAALDGGGDKFNLYEWSAGQLRLLNVLPNGETVPGAAFGSGTALDQKWSSPIEDLAGAISTDGSRVFWSSESGEVFARIGSETLAVPGSGASARFLSAAADGSKVLLSSGQLFEFDEEAKAYEPTADLSEGLGGFQGLVGQSEDLSHLYFVDTNVLDPTANEYGDVATAGQPNLYSWEGGESTYVGTLLPGEDQVYEFGTWAVPVHRRAQASPNGRFLAFNSRAELTGTSNVGTCKFESDSTSVRYVDSAPCREVFLYDSASGALRCPSCNPAGEAPHGNSWLTRAQLGPGSQRQLSYLTDSGRLYFDSADRLALADSNGQIQDVYEYEPEGVGTCEKPEGCVALISAGRESTDSDFLSADESGKNVFFVTRDRLTLPDRDELLDLYDAREDGGIPAETEPPPPTCQGEACAAPYSPPAAPNLGSLGSRRSGNVQEAPVRSSCAKGKVRRKGRCVAKKPHHRAKHKSKHSRRAGANRGGAK